ncbi:L-asparaginase II [Rhodobacteraceae bacterium THAF1]|uniref:asparaginase n=1 Tax=Palleronia sp. THAF1 TaxID=2587842 RepID=UPI000F3AC19D|nr:asparaginase [Palleronia sp. THAF1]QFU07278.1 L-asparaginase II [Palleronia sp. THAF1]VDC20810.1 L-asparaginase II [Rhodobacteraceae bacterium THAF1]
MADATPLIELWRGDLSESIHRGHAVVMDDTGQVVHAWGDPDAIIFPRSSCKMLQALPMVEAGVKLSTERLALACASHEGAPEHVAAVRDWITEQGYSDDDFLCGHEAPRDREAKHAMIRAGGSPDQAHNQCSGKHAGFLHFQRHLGAKGAYVDPNGPVQKAVRAAFEEVTQENSPGFGIDGCAAPNFATSVSGLARAMTAFATATEGQGARQSAMAALRDAMMAHPWLVAGTGKATTRLMEAAKGKAAVKIGAEGVYVAMLPELRMGVALKIADGAGRGADAAMAAILVKLGVLAATDPAVTDLIDAPILNRAGEPVGAIRRATGFCD